MSRASLNQLVRTLRCRMEAQRLDGLADAELLDRFRIDHDPSAFEAIVRRYGDRVLTACRKVLADAADVEDAFQATFLVLLREAPAIRKREALGGWLYGVAHRLSLQARSRAARRACVEARTAPVGAEEGLDVSWREACTILHEELDRLPDTYRLPLILCYLDGKSRDEAAQELGIKIDVLRGRLERGRDRLRGRLLKRGIALSVGLLALVANSVTAGGPPEHLFRETLRSAAGGRVSARVAALLHGATPTMTLGKCKLVGVAVLVLGLLGGGLGVRMHGAPALPQTHGKTAASLATADVPLPLLPAPKRDGSDPRVGSVAVSGKVIGPDGKPVPQARLFVFDPEECKPAPQAEAGADGAFAFELGPLAERRGYRYLVATAPDLGLGCDWTGVAAATHPLKDAVLRLPKDEPIRGRIVDLEGKPVAGAGICVTNLETGKDNTLDEFVRLWTKDREQQQLAFGTLIGKRLHAMKGTAAHFTATTDADGRFTLRGLGCERCPELTVRATGKASQVCIVPIRPGYRPVAGGFTGSPVLGPEFTLPLAPAKPIAGVVRDAQKKPLAGVRVLAQVDRNDDKFLNSWLILPDVETVTDADGRYSLDGLPKAKGYVLVADPKPGAGLTHRFAECQDAPGFAPLTVDFELPRGVVLTGHVADKKTGKPVRAYLFYSPLWTNKWVDEHPHYESHGLAPWYSDAQGWTDGEGRFEVTVVPGPGILHVQVLGHALEQAYVPARLGAEDDTDEILAKQLQFGSMKMFATRGQGGSFGPRNLNAYRVLRVPADAKTASADVTVDPGVERSLRIVGPDGKPVSGAWVVNERVFGGFSNALAGAEVTVFSLDPEQPRRIYAQHDTQGLAGFVALDGKETGPAVLKLQRTATVVGRVVDRDGKPLKDAAISPSYDDPEIGILLNTRGLSNNNPIRTDADGKFTLPNIPADLSVRFDARAKGGAFLGNTVDYTLKAGATLDLGEWKQE